MSPREDRDEPAKDSELFAPASFQKSTASHSLPSVQQFVDSLERSQLVPRRQLDAMRNRVLAEGQLNAREFAQTLVESGHLTRWQAERLLARKSGFLVGKYRLLDRIGIGGMAVVLRGQQVEGVPRTVAIKVLARTLLKRDEAVKRFFREIEAASSLDHPNIVRALDSDCIDGVPFLVMEFVDGRDLQSLVNQRGALPVTWACEFTRQAAIGLQHAFERNIVHRDVKPANLLVTQKPNEDKLTVKILDFGLARFASESPEAGLTSADQIFGTVDFISPEQARSARSADTRSDIFSLGCTLYFLLTAKTPFRGETAMEKLTARITEGPIPIETQRPDIPDALAAVVMKMLARDPKDRYQTPADVARALAPFANAAGDEADAGVLSRRGDERPPGASESELALENFLGHLDDNPSPPNSSESIAARSRMRPAVVVTAVVLCSILAIVAVLQVTSDRARAGKAVPEAGPNAKGQVDGSVPIPLNALTLPDSPAEEQGLIAAWRKGAGTKLTGHLFASDWGLELRENAEFDAAGSLILDRGTVAVNGPAGLLGHSCRESHEFTLELMLAASDLKTGNAPRIVSLSGPRHSRIFSLAQRKGQLIATLSTSLTADGKSPSEVELCKVPTDRPRHIVLTYRDGQLLCYLDGVVIADRNDVRGNLGGWETEEIVLGDDQKGRNWSGRIERFALFSRFLSAEDAQRLFERAQSESAERAAE